MLSYTETGRIPNVVKNKIEKNGQRNHCYQEYYSPVYQKNADEGDYNLTQCPSN